MKAIRGLLICGTILWMSWVLITWLSGQFQYQIAPASRPIAFVVGLFLFQSIIYLIAIRFAVRHTDQTAVWSTVLTFAVAMRLVVLFSSPIQEIDYYRYLWDGITVNEGVSAYRYSPHQVLTANIDDPDLPDALRRLVERRDRSHQAATIVSRIHYGELPSIYPPVSLAVFSAATAILPESTSVMTAITAMKAWIVFFDLGTLFLLASLMHSASVPIGWVTTYAWCPLVIKEFANSGHLDSIAVFFMTAAVLTYLKGVDLFRSGQKEHNVRRRALWIVLSGLCLGLAIGAKLFPIVLAPIFGLTILRKRGFFDAFVFTLVTVVATGVVCWPMLKPTPSFHDSDVTASFVSNESPRALPPIPTETDPDVAKLPSQLSDQVVAQSQQKSLKVFLSRWKMNDLIFMFIESQIAPDQENGPERWFTLTPNTWRTVGTEMISAWIGTPSENTPFLVTRGLLSVVFIVLAIYWAWRAANSTTATDWLRFLFLTLAWFWMLSPTLNPWYWIWALPFVPFARQRSWLLVSGFVFLYYLRFWLQVEFPNSGVLGTLYNGRDFFHNVVVWIEHLPWMLAVAIESVRRRAG